MSKVKTKRSVKTKDIINHLAKVADISKEQVKIIIDEMADLTLKTILDEEGNSILFQHFVKLESKVKKPRKNISSFGNGEIKPKPRSIRFRATLLGNCKKRFKEYASKLEKKNSKLEK